MLARHRQQCRICAPGRPFSHILCALRWQGDDPRCRDRVAFWLCCREEWAW